MLRSHVITDFLRDSAEPRVEITYLKLKLGLPIFFLSSPFSFATQQMIEGKHNGNLPNFFNGSVKSRKWTNICEMHGV